MTLGLAVRITLPFMDVSGIVRSWALKADQLVVYEHLGEETKKAHVHMLLLGIGCDKERLKQIASPWLKPGQSGNEFWSFKSKSKQHGPVSSETSQRYIIYMTKGINLPMYVKGFALDYLEACKGMWVVKDIAPNRDEQLFAAFEEKIYQFWHEDKLSIAFKPGTTIFRHDQAAVLQRLARSWSFQFHKSIWSIRTAADAKMVFLTYCMRFDIIIPDNIKSW